jgi:hypothetical protein
MNPTSGAHGEGYSSFIKQYPLSLSPLLHHQEWPSSQTMKAQTPMCLTPMCLTPMSQIPASQEIIKIPELLETPPLVTMYMKLSLYLEQREPLKPTQEIQTNLKHSWTTSDGSANDIELRGPRRSTRPSFPTVTPRCKSCYATSLQPPNRIWTSSLKNSGTFME